MSKEEPYIALTIECLPNPKEKDIAVQADFFSRKYKLSEEETVVLVKNLMLYSSALLSKLPKDVKNDFLH